MNRKKIFTSLCLVALLAACSNEALLIERSPLSPDWVSLMSC